MVLNTHVRLLCGLCVAVLASAETCSEGVTLNLKFVDFAPTDAPSTQKYDVTRSACASWCARLYADGCEAMFHETATRTCHVYRRSPPRTCLTLRHLPGTRASVYVQILPRDINVCYAWPTSPGIHPLNISDEYPAPWGYYDTNGWLIIQRRTNMSENFNRPWVEYENGFGNLNHEFWLGNRYIHLLTNQRSFEIQFDLEDEGGATGSIRYASFSLSDGASNYRLRISGPSSSKLGDDLSAYNNVPFSTWDREHDTLKNRNCAVLFSGGWWYRGCSRVALNSLFTETSTENRWQSYSKRIASSVIRIKPR